MDAASEAVSSAERPTGAHTKCGGLLRPASSSRGSGASGIRTRDLPDANRTLSQLSYGPAGLILGVPSRVRPAPTGVRSPSGSRREHGSDPRTARRALQGRVSGRRDASFDAVPGRPRGRHPGAARACRPRPRRSHPIRRHGRGRSAGRRRRPEAASARAACRTRAVTGGALNLDNSGSSGAGAVLYSNRGADALGRLLVVNQANPANPQHAVRIQNAGTAHTVSIFHDPAGGAGDPDRRGGRHRLDQRAGHGTRRDGVGRPARARSRSPTASQPARTPTRRRCRSRSREPARHARASTSATTPATRPPATCCTSVTAGRARTCCG